MSQSILPLYLLYLKTTLFWHISIRTFRKLWKISVDSYSIRENDVGSFLDWYGKVLVGDMLYSNIKGSTITADLCCFQLIAYPHYWSESRRYLP